MVAWLTMEISKTNKIIIIFGFIIIVVVLGFLLYKKTKTLTNASDGVLNVSTTTTTQNGLQISSEGTGDYKIEQVPVNEGREVLPQPVPDLNRKLVFLSSLNLTQEAKDIITSKVKDLQSQLKKDATFVTGWIDLGIYQKMAGDYDGAAISWTYVTKLVPSDYISFGNLGDLYAYYLKNNALSETSYKKAISNAPKQAYLYIQLAGVYKDVFKDMDKARAIIDQGLKNLPDDKGLLEWKTNNLK
ncbi:MAG: hypothetical protein AB201_02845 [Parcubacteria bacterium C7867-006]|nr:MAG: hypothetical protein AB201_02845 [Parcubacteria bacterium C7867-006]